MKRRSYAQERSTPSPYTKYGKRPHKYPFITGNAYRVHPERGGKPWSARGAPA